MEENNKVEETNLYKLSDFEDSMVSTTISEVLSALKEKGYNEINQLVGYLMSGDPGYISSYKDSRSKISKIERSTIIETLLRDYINKL